MLRVFRNMAIYHAELPVYTKILYAASANGGDDTTRHSKTSCSEFQASFSYEFFSYEVATPTDVSSVSLVSLNINNSQ